MARSDDIALAKKLCDPYLKTRVVGQHLDTETEDGLKLYQAGHRISTVLAITNAKLGQDKAQYWINIGDKQTTQPDGSGLWCDGSAGMIVSLLAQHADFKSKLEVVKQSDPKVHGHWFVVANRPDSAALTWGKSFGDDSFVIDIWGALRSNEKSSVIDPGRAIFDCGSTGNPSENVLVSVCTIPAK